MTLVVTAHLLVGFLVLAWQVGAALVIWVAVPTAISLLNLAAMREAYRGAREPSAGPSA